MLHIDNNMSNIDRLDHELAQTLLKAKETLTTINDVLRFMVSNFTKYKLYFGHGTNNAFDEAVYLILATLNLPIDDINSFLYAKLLPSEIDLLLNICNLRIIKRIPAPYITNTAYLCGLSFFVDKRVIIPRSFIAHLIVNNQLDVFIDDNNYQQNHKTNILDLCTGNGSLAIIMANYFNNNNIIAIDIDAGALEVANININQYNLQQQITTKQSDMFAALDKHKYHNYFDLIISNPPYVDKKRMQDLPQEYQHEPRLALAGGDNGLSFVDNILSNAYNYLTDNGILVVEIGDNQDELEVKYPHLAFQWLNLSNDEANDENGFVFLLTKNDLEPA